MNIFFSISGQYFKNIISFKIVEHILSSLKPVPMRSILLAIILLGVRSHPNNAQNYFVSKQYEDFFTWFHERAQIEQLYTNKATLYIFTDGVNVRRQPNATAPILTQLPIGHAVTNVSYDKRPVPKAEINGYGDVWLHVRGTDAAGKPFDGYVWGAHIAKGWREADLHGTGQPSLIMLGVAAKPRQRLQDINAEIRMVQGGKLIGQTIVPGLCVFEDCGASPMLRILQSRNIPSLTIVEAATMTIGCTAGIEKSYFYWSGKHLERVYHAEYTTNTEMFRKKFTVIPDKLQGGMAQLCEYGGEDSGNNPIWNCRNLPPAPVAEGKPIAAN
jgi:hypothetical protein